MIRTADYFFVFTLLSALMLLSNAGISQQHITTLQLHHTDPQLLLPVIKAQLSPTSSVQAYQNKLILNVTDDELKKIKALIRQLDAAGKQLLITVKKADQEMTRQQTGKAQMHFQGNPDIKVGSEHGNSTNNRLETSVNIKNQYSTHTGSSANGIRATEGKPVYISTGSTILINNNTTGSLKENRQPIDANSGFYATAWVDDRTVTVLLDQQQNKFQTPSTITSQQLQTRVTGNLGEWIPVGYFNNSESSANRQIGSKDRRNNISATPIYLKVDLAQ